VYGDGDGDITLSELGHVRLADVGIVGRYVQPKGAPKIVPKVSTWTTLEDFVYLGLYPLVARFEDKGTCSLGDRREE
jgi:hypothetical protein